MDTHACTEIARYLHVDIGPTAYAVYTQLVKINSSGDTVHLMRLTVYLLPCSLQCLYCERTFRDRSILKEHMRKKQHKKINPKNTLYDKYYVINYLEFGKTWEDVQSEDDREIIPMDNTYVPLSTYCTPPCIISLPPSSPRSSCIRMKVHVVYLHPSQFFMLVPYMGSTYRISPFSGRPLGSVNR